jgi:hypothetical protein
MLITSLVIRWEKVNVHEVQDFKKSRVMRLMRET